MSIQPESPSPDDSMTLREVVIFPTTIDHPDYGRIKIVDYMRPHEYLEGVYAFVDPNTGEYGGLILEDNTPIELINKD